MAYAVEKESSVTDCDALTRMLAKEKDDLHFRVIVLNRQIRSYTAKAQELTADLIAVDAEIASLNTQLEVMPAGERREKLITDLDRTRLRKRTLSARQQDFGSVALVEREVELAMNAAQLAVVNAAIADVAARKVTLTEAG